MEIKIFTIFPGMFTGPLEHSILKRAQEQGLLRIETIDVREFSQDKHHKVDDYPFGGGAGMVMQVAPFSRCLDAFQVGSDTRVILLSPQGDVFNQEKAQDLAGEEKLALICGHYEGIDDRVRHLITDEISLGDFILTGGEIAALAVIDSVARLVPGVIGTAGSLLEESFNKGLLEYPHYTRPRSFKEWDVPEVLVSGDHQAVARWRRAQAVQRTFFRRPDLLQGVEWTEEDQQTVTRIFLPEEN